MIISILRLLCELIPTILGPIVPFVLKQMTNANTTENTSSSQGIQLEGVLTTINVHLQAIVGFLMGIHEAMTQGYQSD